MHSPFQHDLPTRFLRMLVPASLAGGFIAVYPAIAERVMVKLGPGFRPALVAVYVSTLVLLFLIDAWARDTRLLRLRRQVEEARRRTEIEIQRARELALMVDLTSALEGAERLECAMLAALQRLRVDVPYAVASIHVPENGNGPLRRRGICPLTATPSEAAAVAAEIASTAESSDPVQHGDGTVSLVALPLRARGAIVGVIVIEGIVELTPTLRKRLVAAADRFASVIAARRLVAELDEKERSLRGAWRELRLSGGRLARSSAKAETAALAEDAGQEVQDEVEEARRELKQLRRSLESLSDQEVARPRLDRLDARFEALGRIADRLTEVGRWVEPPAPVELNGLIVAVIDLVAPELRRSRIEVHMRLDRTLDQVEACEGPLFHLLIKLMRRLRAELRRTPEPRRIEVETKAFGTGFRIAMRANSAGLEPRARGLESTSAGNSRPAKALEDNDLDPRTPRSWRPLLRAARAAVTRRRKLGEGLAYTVTIHAVAETRPL